MRIADARNRINAHRRRRLLTRRCARLLGWAAVVLTHLVNTLGLTRESPSYSIVKDHGQSKDERARAETEVYNCTSTKPGLPSSWCLDGDKVPRFVGKKDGGVPLASVEHYTHAGYEECLAGKTLIFIGDSRVRYQFMHLARFLVHGRSMRCRDFDSPATEQSTGGKVSTDDEGCKVIDHDLRTTTGYGKDWNDWYKSSTDLLKKKGEQDSLCDCFRPDKSSPDRMHVDRWYENRYVSRSTRYGKTSLVYLQNFKDLVHIGEDFPPFAPFTLPSDKTSRCAPGECRKGNRVDAFNGDLKQTIWFLPSLNATHAFVNVGWAELEEPIDNLKVNSDLSCTILDFEASYPDIDVTLMSHIPLQGYAPRADASFSSFADRMECPARVLDRYAAAENVPESWYFDRLHVLGILNEQYNHDLIEHICPLKVR